MCDPAFLSAIKLAVGPVEGEYIGCVLDNSPHHVIVALCLCIPCVSVLDKCDVYWSVVVFYGECVPSLTSKSQLPFNIPDLRLVAVNTVKMYLDSDRPSRVRILRVDN